MLRRGNRNKKQNKQNTNTRRLEKRRKTKRKERKGTMQKLQVAIKETKKLLLQQIQKMVKTMENGKVLKRKQPWQPLMQPI